MAEIVASAVVSETISRISTFLIDKYYDRKSSKGDDAERLEMAHIKMETVLEASGKWPPVTDVSLLRWRKKLKRASEECDAVLRRRKRRSTAEDQEARQRSFRARISHATRSLLSSSGHKDDESIDSSEVVVRRYERFAEGAGEFLRFVELGSVRRQMLILDPLVGHLLGGRAFQYEISQGRRRYYFTGRPVCFAERGLEAGVKLRCQDQEEDPEEKFVMGILTRVGESTNLIAIVAECLESFTPQLKRVADVAKQELDRVHTRGMYCYPFLASTDPAYWNFHLWETRRARPDPLCCKGGHEQENSSGMKKLPGELPEPVIKLFVQRHFSVSKSKRRQSSRKKKKTSPSVVADHGLLLTAVFAPHASTEELPSGVENLAVEVIGGNRGEQTVHENVGLHELEELLLPGDISRLCNGAHEVFWRSGHGVAYLCLEKSGTDMGMSRATQWAVADRKCSAWERH